MNSLTNSTRCVVPLFASAVFSISILSGPVANASGLQFNFSKEQLFFQMSEDFVHHTGYGASAFVEAPVGSFTQLMLNGTHELVVDPDNPEEWSFMTARPPGLIKEDLDLAFPSSSTYTFDYSGGELIIGSFSIDIGPDAYPAITPSLAPGSFTAAQSVDPTQAFTLHWNDHGAYADMIFIDWSVNGIFASSDDLPASTTSFEFAADTFTPGGSFTIEIFFVNVSVMDEDDNATGYINILTVPLNTVPEPRMYAFLFGAAVAGAALLRRRRV